MFSYLVLHVGHDLLQAVLSLLGVVCAAIVEVDDLLPVLNNLLRNQGNVNGEAVATGSLPSGLADPTAADLVQAAGGVRALVAAESEDKRSNVVGLEGVNHLLRHDGGGHGGTGVGSNGVDVDAVLEALESKGTREAENTAFLWFKHVSQTRILFKYII